MWPSKRFAGNDRKMRMNKPLVVFYVRRMSASGVPDSTLDCLPGKSVTVSTPVLNGRRGGAEIAWNTPFRSKLPLYRA
jgi:hypothetical protein